MHRTKTATRVLSLVVSLAVVETAGAMGVCLPVKGGEIDTVRVMDEALVTARAADSRVLAMHPVQKMTARDVESLGIENVGQALARMAGTQVRDYGGVGGMKTVSVHSLGAAHTGVTYDGVTVSDCQAGQIDLGRFFIDNIGELSLSIGNDDDMLKGASQLSSASMLRLVSMTPSFNGTSSDALRAKVRVGSWGEVTPTVMYAHRFSHADSTASVLGVNAAYQRADGHYRFTLDNGSNPLRYRRTNTDIESGTAEMNWDGTVGRGGRLEAKAYGYASERGLPGAAIYYNNVSHQRLWDVNAFGQLRYTQQWNRWRLQARAKYNYAYNRYEDRDSKYPTGLKRDRYMQHEVLLSATAAWAAAKDVDVALAQDVRLNTLDMRMGTTGYQPDPRRITSYTSLQARWQTDHVGVNGSLLLTAGRETVAMGRAMDMPMRLSPSLAVSYRPWMAHRLVARAMYKSTYRLPSFNDLYYDRIGNTELHPERADEWSLGMAWERQMGRVWLSATADGYVHRVSDKIVAMPGVYVWKMLNYGTVHIGGVDAAVRADWRFARGCRLAAEAVYTYQRAVDRTDPQRVSYGCQLPYTPRHSGNLSATVETRWLSASWNMQAMGSRYAMAATTAANLMPAFTVHDINVWHEFALRRTVLRLQLGVYNVADRQYDIIRFYPMPTRHLALTLTLKL